MIGMLGDERSLRESSRAQGACQNEFAVSNFEISSRW